MEEVQGHFVDGSINGSGTRKAEPDPISGEALAGADKAGLKVRGLYYRVVCDVGWGLLTSLWRAVRAQGAKGGAP